MGWWPSSTPGTNANAETQQSSIPPIPSSQSTQAAPEIPAAEIPALETPAPPPPTVAPHDPDFYAAHPHLAPPSFNSNTTADFPSTSTTTSSPTSSTTEEPSFDPSLPRTMSCRAAFDSAFYCSSLGGHFNDIYRYGQLRNCSEHWNDFWFCMRTKNSYNDQETKQLMVQDRYREKESKVREKPNSEDVWVMRKPGEEVRGAFGGDGEL